MKRVTKILVSFIATLAILSTSIKSQDLPGVASNPRCKCPAYEVVANFDTVKAGDAVEFRIVSRDLALLDKTFEWTISAGTIISGQGTSKITLHTTADMLPPPPTPLPSPGEHGFILSLGRRGVPITATAALTDSPDCCQPISGSVSVGTQSGVVNRPANVIALMVSHSKLVAPCEPGRVPAEGQVVSENMIVAVKAYGYDPDEDVLTYNFEVSAGKIIGRGSDVRWDLTGVKPGIYSITAGADDGCGLCGKTWTETVSVEACVPSCGFVECPSIDIKGPNTLTAGAAVFTANVSGGAMREVTYNWAIAHGLILHGQGTPSITVKMPDHISDRNFSITVNIGGLEKGSCISSVTKEYLRGRLKP